jgi:soluble lytic murein transglycosylase-like protein
MTRAIAREGAWTLSCAFLFMLSTVTILFTPLGRNMATVGTQVRMSLPRVFEKPPAFDSIFERELAMSQKALLERWQPIVEEASRRFGMPEAWILAVISRESGGRTVGKGDVPITSGAGAMGLMQLMPGTYEEMRQQYGLGADPYNPHDNVIAATAYLKWLHSRYGYPNMFVAYNDGPGNFEKSLANKHDLPKESTDYVAAVTAKIRKGRKADRA